MNVALRFADIPQIADFAPSALYLLSAPSTPDEARQEAISRPEAGERISYSEAKKIVTAHEHPELDATLTELEAMISQPLETEPPCD